MTRVDHPPRVAVVGTATADDQEYATARALGSALGRRGAVVVCGGKGGVMEAVALGAAEVGAITVGLLPGESPADANPWILVPLPTGMGEARNALVVRAAEAVLSVGGRWGTLSEIALAKQMGLDVGLLGAPPASGLGLPSFADVEEAADWALERASTRRTRGSR